MGVGQSVVRVEPESLFVSEACHDAGVVVTEIDKSLIFSQQLFAEMTISLGLDKQKLLSQL